MKRVPGKAGHSASQMVVFMALELQSGATFDTKSELWQGGMSY